VNFLNPLAFSLAALLPVIVALYFLKLRREERTISSTYLWRTLVRDTAANAPWQKLKPNLLLLLQLLFLIALIAALARPFVWSEAAAGSHLILVIDTSASMGATDVQPNRLGAALASAQRLIESLPSSGRVTVIEAGAQVRVPVSGASNPGTAIAALAALRPGPAGADFESALTLAAAIAAREPDSEVVIFSDGRVTLPDNLTLPGRARYIPVGAQNDNQAIGVFSVQAEASGQSLTAFVQMVNYSATTVSRRLVLRNAGDGQLLAARDVTLIPGKAQAYTFPGLSPDAGAIEAQLEGQDALAADDRAWAVPPSTGQSTINLVSPGNRFLETVLDLIPNFEVSINQPITRSAVSGQPPAVSTYQLTIFDSVVPTTTMPEGNLLFIAPPRSTELFSVTGMVLTPTLAPVVADDPLLRYAEADLRDVAVQDASRVALPQWGRAVMVDSKSNAPMLIIGEQAGRRIGVLAFDLRKSDLPLRVAFPILMANLLDALMPGGASGIPASVEAGRPLVIPALPQAEAIIIRAPDGGEYTLSSSEGRVVFEQTSAFGVYEITWQSGSKRQAMGRFAVNLFSPTESNITPRETLSIASAGAAGKETLPRARDEWWRPIAWIALAVLVAEWLLSNRGGLAKLIVNR